MKFYSSFYKDIPEGIINKKICGCGLTSYALENPTPVILSVPTVEMIKNKIAQYPNERRNESLFGLYQGITLTALEEYLNQANIPKILVTYDSLYKLVPYIKPSYHIIIDEFSELLDCYSFRSKAINKLLEFISIYKQTNKISFISATPTKPEYLPTICKTYPVTELDWNNTILEKVSVEAIETTKPLNAVINIINKYRNNLVANSNQGFFFVNSVNMIKTILDRSELLPSEVHIICSNNERNLQTLDYFPISSTNDINYKPRKFNFITSTGFKGCDFYSESGISYVVSNNQNINTLLTIDTDIYQIAGRIRTVTNPFRNYIVHIFNKNPLHLTKERSLELIDEQKQRSLSVLNNFQKAKGKERDDLLYMYRATELKEVYLRVTDDNLEYDDLKELLERRIYETVIQVYQDGLSIIKNYESSTNIALQTNNIKVSNLTKRDFISVFREYYKDPNSFNKEELQKSYPLILEAHNLLGLDKCYSLGFAKGKIVQEINLIKSNEFIKKYLKDKVVVNTFISLSDINTTLIRIYKELDITKKPKATEIENYLEVRKCTKVIEGKRTRGYIRIK